MVNRVYLIGFMGSGKTTIGKFLAIELSWKFLDLDQYIEEKERRTITQIFAEDGESGFRKIETEALNDVANMGNVIIACGGGTPCFGNNVDVMRRSGLTIYLSVTPEELTNRLKFAKRKRPLIANKSNEELLSYIKEKIAEREPFYSKAHLTVDGVSTPFSAYAGIVESWDAER